MKKDLAFFLKKRFSSPFFLSFGILDEFEEVCDETNYFLCAFGPDDELLPNLQ
jgi:hypothetical protein